MKSLPAILVISCLLAITSCQTTRISAGINPESTKQPVISANTQPWNEKHPWFLAALETVKRFEASREDAFTKVTLNFDGMGISCGVLQWNMGKTSLQRFVREKLNRDLVLQHLGEAYGPAFWDACLVDAKEPGLSLVNSWQHQVTRSAGGNPVWEWRPEHRQVEGRLKSLLGMADVREKQLVHAWQVTGSKALDAVRQWALASKGAQDAFTLRQYTVFLDTFVFNGSMEGLSHANVLAFQRQHTRKNLLHLVCDWLGAAKAPMYQVTEAKANATLWRDRQVSQEELKLFILSYLRALRADGDNGKFKANVLSRRGTIIFNDGWVNKTRLSFPGLGRLEL